MKSLRTNVVASYPFTGWLECFGADDIAEMQVLGEGLSHIAGQVDAGWSLW